MQCTRLELITNGHLTTRWPGLAVTSTHSTRPWRRWITIEATAFISIRWVFGTKTDWSSWTRSTGLASTGRWWHFWRSIQISGQPATEIVRSTTSRLTLKETSGPFCRRSCVLVCWRTWSNWAWRSISRAVIDRKSSAITFNYSAH